ncbi:MAG: VCBS repeat-containing protein [bacterium]|nr:VCBS repeat-containing protein [bacterium]
MTIPTFSRVLPTASLLSLVVLATGCARHSGVPVTDAGTGVPRFETRTEISTGTGQHADYHVADLNGDGVLDMAVIGLSGELKVLIGNGTTFDDGQELQIDGSPIWMDGGDFDGDQDIDLVVVRIGNNTANVYLNDGTGTFSPGAELQVGTHALAVVVADTDGDTDLDIVVTRQVAPEVRVFTNDGSAQFGLQNSPMLPNGGLAFNLTVGDVSRDGLPDLVIMDPLNSRVVVFLMTLGQFMPVFELDVPGGPRAASLGDLNADGFLDIAVSAFTAGKLVVITDIDFSGGGATPAPYTSFDVQLTAAPTLSAIGDVTGDGLQDLVACQEGAASIVVAPQLPSGGLGDYEQLDATGLPLRPFIGDVDNDGNNDLMALSGLGDRINLWRADQNGRLLGAYNYDAMLSEAAFLGAGDFDRDGEIEVAVGGFTNTQLAFMKRNAAGRLETVRLIDIGSTVLQVETVDLDLDDRLDLLVSVAGGVKVLRNRTAASGIDFEVLPGLAVAVSTASSPFGVTAADFDRDGFFDIAVCDYGMNTVHVVQGTSTPFVFGNEQVISLAGAPADLVAADFTGDGNLDLAVSRVVNSDIAILENDGSGNFTQLLALPVGQAPNYLITGDFDRDSTADLVVSNGADGTITILFGSANGFSGVSFPAGQTPTALLADDLNGDGVDDVLVTSLQSGDFRVLVGDGQGSFPNISRFPGTLGASDAALADIDGDGRRDLLIASLITSRVSLVRNIFESVPPLLPATLTR